MPRGVLQEPVSVSTLDDQMFTMRFDPPLAGGEVGIRWNVQAADAHPINGAFSFTVTAPLPSTAPPSTIPEASAPVTNVSGGDADVTSTDVATTEVATTEVATGVSATDPPSTAGSAVVGGDVDAEGAAATTVSLEEFLAVDDAAPGETTTRIGRMLGLVGVVLALGAIAFGRVALRGSHDEIRRFLTGIGMVSALLVLGAVVEYVGVVRLADESLGTAWTTSPGFATVLRMVGGLALIAGLVISLRSDEVRDRRSTRSLSASVIDDPAIIEPSVDVGDRSRWAPARSVWPIGVGAVAILASFLFDGHTVTEGFRPLHAVVNVVHVAAGSVWVGGVVSLCAVAWMRHRAGRPAGVAELAIRFSRIATLALGAVVVAGAVMAFIVLDSFGDLTGTEWGQTLLLKTAAVAVAIVLGGYNHLRLVPALDAEPSAEQLGARLRATITAEVIILVFVVVVTASLVAAATV